MTSLTGGTEVPRSERYGSHPEEEGPMKRVVLLLVAAIGIAVVLGGGIWVAGAVNTASKAMTPTTVVNPQMAAVPNGGVSTGDGSMSN